MGAADILAEGRCICGALRYGVTAPPGRVMICHCRFCQRATGGAYMVDAVFSNRDFRVLEGTPKTYDHVSEGSGKVVTIHFCAACGTKQFATFERMPDVVGVYAGTFDDPNWFDRSPGAVRHIFTDVAAHWTVLPEGALYFPGGPVQDGVPQEPAVLACAGPLKR